MASIKTRAAHILISLDQTAWSFLTLGAAYPDETISAGCYRLMIGGSRVGKLAVKAIDKLFFWQHEHCYNAWLEEVLGKQNHPSYKDKA